MLALLAISRRPPRALSQGPGTATDDQALEEMKGAPFPAEAAFVATEKIPPLPNLVTLSGYASSIAWLSGASTPYAIYGLLADEADGRIARATGQTSKFGGLFDWAVDITLTGLVLSRLGWTWLLLLVTPAQVILRDAEWRPTIGSARAVFTVIALIREAIG